ncbi:hypothetical protein S40285_09860 [Stachybotrys chlorohalonatus IBT 40285]|uniref:Uncharacterized protein n=1 Tax=Stachybotrys chlorohalonatus (strain IBT 40285) TaxID=1283841 RepID=A0A084QR70_STAC4|nr:hypothetical protein S40285_09860 [Stachybotrys chlorohalonata IBT 40285]
MEQSIFSLDGQQTSPRSDPAYAAPQHAHLYASKALPPLPLSAPQRAAASQSKGARRYSASQSRCPASSHGGNRPLGKKSTRSWPQRPSSVSATARRSSQKIMQLIGVDVNTPDHAPAYLGSVDGIAGRLTTLWNGPVYVSSPASDSWPFPSTEPPDLSSPNIGYALRASKHTSWPYSSRPSAWGHYHNGTTGSEDPPRILPPGPEAENTSKLFNFLNRYSNDPKVVNAYHGIVGDLVELTDSSKPARGDVPISQPMPSHSINTATSSRRAGSYSLTRPSTGASSTPFHPKIVSVETRRASEDQPRTTFVEETRSGFDADSDDDDDGGFPWISGRVKKLFARGGRAQGAAIKAESAPKRSRPSYELGKSGIINRTTNRLEEFLAASKDKCKALQG